METFLGTKPEDLQIERVYLRSLIWIPRTGS